MSPRKVRLVIDTIRGLSVKDAEVRLSFIPKAAARPVLKLLRSAVANAEHNFHLSKDGLTVARITADGGPTLKRHRPRAFGRAAMIRKRTTHILLTLSSPGPTVAAKTEQPATAPKQVPASRPVRSKKAQKPTNMTSSKNA
jgi:large subunit ribosomal protein L22